MEETNFLKEMVYEDLEGITNGYTVLAKGEYKGYQYLVISYGTHPCCYVKLEEGDKNYGKHYDEINVACHGGLTFSEMEQNSDRFPDGYWIGWDYAHAGDAFGVFYNGIQYTTIELIEDVKNVIDQLAL